MSVGMESVKWDERGLVPVIIQSERKEVLTLGWMNAEALEQSLESGLVHLWSRSKGRVRMKGEVSGFTQKIMEIRQDCDQDALLMIVEPNGPACHTGAETCFFRKLEGDYPESPSQAPDYSLNILKELEDLILRRHESMPEGSYTTKLFSKGKEMIYKKFGEEAVEVLVAQSKDQSVYEIADLLYHLMVLMRFESIRWNDVMEELAKRRNT